jgi:hypothetical protein
MHSAPSHFDGVEHTLASVAAAAAATALRGGDDGSIEPACTDAPDGARGDAKMHSAPSRYDGVEHTLASVAAAAAATALRRCASAVLGRSPLR